MSCYWILSVIFLVMSVMVVSLVKDMHKALIHTPELSNLLLVTKNITLVSFV